MKFGNVLDRHGHAEWRNQYISYNHLIKSLKLAVGKSERIEEWFVELDEEVSRVNHFFLSQIEQLNIDVDELENALNECSQDDSNNKKFFLKEMHQDLNRCLRKLEIIDNYSSLNYTGFYKVLKKHDKLTGYYGLHLLTALSNETFQDHTLLQATQYRLHTIQRVHFGDDFIPPDDELGQPEVKFLFFFLGCVLVSLSNVLLMTALPATNPDYTTEDFIKTTPIFRFFFMNTLVTWMSGWVLRVFEKYKINWIFLLNIESKALIQSNHILAVASLQTLVWACVFLVYLADYKFGIFFDESNIYPYYPTVLACLQGLVYFIPSAVIRYKYRLHLLSCLLSVITSPLRAVTFASNILGDVLTSFNRPLCDLYYLIIFLIWDSSYEDAPLMGIWLGLPLWFRFLQCLRRFYDTREKAHIFNAGKYFTGLMMTGVPSLGFSEVEGSLFGITIIWSLPVLVACTVATCYNLIWDIFMDWRLFEFGPFRVRAQRIFPNHYYYSLVVLNVILRLSWAFNMIPIRFIVGKSPVGHEIIIYLISIAEIYRRAQWALLRMESEHLFNSSKYRGICWIPPLQLESPQSKGFGNLESSLLNSPTLGSTTNKRSFSLYDVSRREPMTSKKRLLQDLSEYHGLLSKEMKN